MKMKRSRVQAGAVAILSIALVAVGVTPAHAGYGGRSCGNYTVYGESSANWAKTYTDYYDLCGPVSARAKYVAYVGGPTYWTSWKTSSSGAASVDRSNTIRGGHRFSGDYAQSWETAV